MIPQRPTVVIITCCTDMELLYGSTLIFNTLRVGFPTARVVVLDNNSLLTAQRVIAREADRHDCTFLPLGTELAAPLPHATCLQEFALNPSLLTKFGVHGGPLVFLDPDVVFWESCEGWEFPGAVLAGRYIPMLHTYLQPAEREQVIMLPRLHTSFLWMPDIDRLRERIRARSVELGCNEWQPFTASMIPDPLQDGLWWRADTAACLYLACRHEAASFTEAQLNSYDHLFAGSSPAQAAFLKGSAVEDLSWFPRAHEAAKAGDYAALRGVWREQERYFQARVPHRQEATR